MNSSTRSLKRTERKEDSSSTEDDEPALSPPPLKRRAVDAKKTKPTLRFMPSPFKLTSVYGLESSLNGDTVALHDLLGDPLIRECWLFDFLFDVDFIMAHFDEDVRHMVKVKLVHGSWKAEDRNRAAIEEGMSRWSNVESVTAFMPEAFGTHHSKMMVLFRHDDTAEVVIHTANMIPQDWRNFTQGVWCSPRLPLLPRSASATTDDCRDAPGVGCEFKRDLLNYLKHYENKRTGPLMAELIRYDFKAVRAIFIASVPTKQPVQVKQDELKTPWGWVGFAEALKKVPTSMTTEPLIVAQVSSIGTLSETWIDHFFGVLKSQKKPTLKQPQYRVMFPTTDEVRRSLDGYAAGGSIHMRTASARQQKTLARLRHNLVHWAGDDLDELATKKPDKASAPQLAGRRRAAPHIKTFTRFTDTTMTEVQWALLTSANMSTQAWGDVARDGTARICSYETGVLVWPELLAASDETTEDSATSSRMVPTFGRDMPTASDLSDDAHPESDGREEVIVGLRMPYDAPLVRYGPSEMPWVASSPHSEPDWRGMSWPGWTA